MERAHVRGAHGTLSMLDEATTSVGVRWCTPYRKSEYFFALNHKMYGND